MVVRSVVQLLKMHILFAPSPPWSFRTGSNNIVDEPYSVEIGRGVAVKGDEVEPTLEQEYLGELGSNSMAFVRPIGSISRIAVNE